MSLSEEQIARYARQILLPTVGGVGQERLLESAVEVAGEGLAARTAETYLRVGGTQTRVTAATSSGVWLRGGGHRALLRGRAVGFARDGGCPACARDALELGSGESGGADAVLLGSLGAALMQRMLLEQGPSFGQLWLDEDGAVSSRELPACSHGAGNG